MTEKKIDPRIVRTRKLLQETHRRLDVFGVMLDSGDASPQYQPGKERRPAASQRIKEAQCVPRSVGERAAGASNVAHELGEYLIRLATIAARYNQLRWEGWRRVRFERA